MNIKEIIKITLNLVIIYVIGGLLLAWVYSQTSPIIYKNREEDKANALKAMMPIHLVANTPSAALDKVKSVLPEGAEASFDEPYLDALVDVYKKEKAKLAKSIKKAGAVSVTERSDYSPEEKGEWEPVAKKHGKYYEVMGPEGKVAGYIVESYHKGYSGAPGIFVAMDKDLKVLKVEVISHSETPGLGDEIEKNWFKDQFRGKGLGQLEVVKGETDEMIQAITGATISTRAITYAARDAVELIQKYKAGELPAPGEAGMKEEGSSGH